MTDKKHYIYGIISPETNEIVYIGRSTNPSKRVKQHPSDGTNSRKLEWFRKMKAQNMKVGFCILETCINETKAKDAERKWIELQLDNGAFLLNWIYPGYSNKEMIAASNATRRGRLGQYYDNL